jgi:SAM-dependent methyltransferase
MGAERSHSELVEAYETQVHRGERPSPVEALAYLRAWHARHPDDRWMIGDRQLADGRSSYELLASALPVGMSGTVVDLACGDGGLSEVLVGRLAPSARIIGVDASESDVERARERVRGASVSFRCETASAMSLESASVDAVLCHWALMLFGSLDEVVAEIARVLAPGGVFAAVIPVRWSIASVSPALQELADELRAEDLPGFPDIGLGDPALGRLGVGGFFNPDSGFVEPATEVQHALTVRWEAARFVDSLRCLYWFDLLRAGNRQRLLDGARRLLGEEPVELCTQVTIVSATRAGGL